MAFSCPDMYRIRMRGAPLGDATCGAFMVPSRLPSGPSLRVIAASDMGWEHVSVSTEKRCPTWEEMCRIKDLFWGPEDVVMQLHPARSEYVNRHPYCLHLWRPTGATIPTPPRIMVG